MKAALFAFLAGALFAVGLIIGGMTQPSKVVGFLDFAGDWDPSLALVMGGALLTHGLSFRLISRRASPLFENEFHLPSLRDIDRRLLSGAALFGVGWGLAGYCPGPALASLTTGLLPLTFVAAMVAGMHAYKLIERLTTKRSSLSS